MTKALAAKLLAARRAEVHDRYVKHWAKKVLVSPELAAVPIKDIDAQLASKFEVHVLLVCVCACVWVGGDCLVPAPCVTCLCDLSSVAAHVYHGCSTTPCILRGEAIMHRVATS